MSGTSMASPSTAGVAALIHEYFPELKAPEVRAVLMKTVTTTSNKVDVPGLYKKKAFGKNKTKPVQKKVSEICIAGGFVNANNAVKELMKLNNENRNPFSHKKDNSSNVIIINTINQPSNTDYWAGIKN